MNALHLLAPVVVLLPGAGLLALLGARRERPLAVRASWAFVAGAAYTGFAVFLASEAFALPIRAAQVRVLLSLPLGLGGAALWWRRGDPTGGRLGRHAALPALGLFLVAIPLLVQAVAVPLADGDGRVTWSAQARHMRFDGSVTPSAVRDAPWFVHHPEYPPLMPAVQVAVLEALDLGEDDRAVRPVYALFFVALVILAADLASTLGGRLSGGLAAALLALLPVMSGESGGAAGAYSDLPLAVFWGGAFLLLLDGRRSRGDTLLAALLLGAAVATKNEGLPYALVALVALALSPRSRKGIAACAVAVAFAAVLVGARKGRIENRLDEDYGQRLLGASTVRDSLDRLSLAVPEALGILSTPRWSGAAVLFVVSGLAGAAALRKRPGGQVALGAVLATAVPLAGYALSPLPPVWLASTTAERFLVHLALPATAILAMTMRQAIARRPGRTAIAGGTGAAVALAAVSLRGGGLPLWPEPSPCPCTAVETAEEDPSLPAWLDQPPESGVVRGDLLVSGWCFDGSAPCQVLDVEIDGVRRRCLRFHRVDRPDAAAFLDRPSQGAGAGFEAVYEFDDADDGDHEILVRVWSPAGRLRTLRARFRWTPAGSRGPAPVTPG